MFAFSSHLTVLEASANLYPSAPAFKIPKPSRSGEIAEWRPISYSQFRRDVERFASYWARTLSADRIARGSVVGLWLGGMSYQDVLHIYGISRAGYVPQLFSLGLTSPVVVSELLRKANAQALIFDPSFTSVMRDFRIPIYFARECTDDLGGLVPEIPKVTSEDDTAFIFHTSGSTSGSPKLVPYSYRWLNSAIRKSRQICAPKHPGRQDVFVWIGSMCHTAQPFMLLGCIQHGSCMIQPTKIGFSTEELADMVRRCSLNRLNQFATFLTTHFKNSRSNPTMVSVLRSLDEVLYTGLPLPREEEEWAYCNGIKLKNIFGSTEGAAMLLSFGGFDHNASLLRPLHGTSYGFFPVGSSASTERGSTGLLELVILAQSDDCPDVSLRQADGHFHTGDLFEEVLPGSYVFRGRDDDWIKSENSLRCDAKSIEDNIRATCGGLVEECVVVGTGRPYPTLFVEPAVNWDPEKLKLEIVRNTQPFNSRRYRHERVTSTDRIVIIPRNSLPRTATKRNVRRRAVEENYKQFLDVLYDVAPQPVKL